MSTDVLRILISEEFLLSSTVGFVTIALLVRAYTINHGPISWVGRAMRWNNYFYSAFSLLLFILILASAKSSYENPLIMPVDINGSFFSSIFPQEKATDHITWARLLYHLSKFYEYIDILLVLAVHGTQPVPGDSRDGLSRRVSNERTKYENPIDVHFAFHHLTTPYLTYFRFVKDPCPGAEIFAALNTLHHVLMYAYFGGAFESASLQKTIRWILPYTGYVQLVVGIAVELYLLAQGQTMNGERCPVKGRLGHYVALGLLTVYFILFTRELQMKVKTSKDDEKKP